MKRFEAIRKYVGTPGNNPDMPYTLSTAGEMKAFKDVCTSEELTQFGRDACDALGETLEE